MLTAQLDHEPLSGRVLIRSQSVRDAEAGGAKLFSQHRLKLLDAPSEFDARVNGVTLGGVSLFYMNYRAALAVAAPAMDDAMGICFPLEGAFQLTQGRHRFEAHAGRSAAVICSSEPFLMEWSPNMSMFCLKIERTALAEFASSLHPSDGRGVDFRRRIESPQAMQSLLGGFRLTELAVTRVPDGQQISVPLAARIRDHLLLTLLISQPNTLSAALSRDDGLSRSSAVRRAVELIEARPAAVTPSEVAQAVGLSLRALEQNFKDRLGTTPFAYILKCRLRRAHSELLAGGNRTGETVSAIARRWGFSNLGRFAEQYRRMYHQTPSETLRHAAGLSNRRVGRG